MKVLGLLLATFLLASCDKYHVNIDPLEIKYSVDNRTNLCFAYMETYTYNAHVVISITSVPCSASVLALVGEAKP